MTTARTSDASTTDARTTDARTTDARTTDARTTDARTTDARTSSLESVLRGVVRDSAGRPLSNVQVVVSTVNRVAMTDEQGVFVIRGLPAGTYHLNLVRIGYVAEHEVVVVPASGADVQVTIVMQVATVRLTSVNVTATPNGADPLNVTQATVQLGGKELQRSLSSSIGQTLAGEPGMSTRFNGPMANAPVIRGLTGERVLVLQDGDRAGDLSSAAADHLNAVDPSSAERIEVIRGPASLLYGNNAIGGVVNVISSDIPTSIPARPSGFVLGQGESVTPGGVASAGITVPLGGLLALTARGGVRHFDDMRVGGGARQDNTHGSTNNVTVGGGVVGDHASFGAVYRQMDFEYGLPHAPDEEAVRLDGHRRMVAVQSNFGTHFAPLSSVKVDGSAQWYAHSEIEPSGEVGTRFALNTQTANITARTQFGRSSGAVGVQGLFRQYTPTGDEAFTPGANNNNVAAFIFQEFPLSHGGAEEQSPRVQLGARYDRFTIDSKPASADEIDRFGAARSLSYDNVAASLGLSVPVARHVSLTANASRGFRAPTVEELFANGFHAAVGTFDVGNAALTPEQATSLEGGLRAQSTSTFAQVNAYFNRIDKYIRPVAVGTADVDGTTVPQVNYAQADADLYGIEGQLETKLPNHLVGGVMGDLTRASLREGGGNLPYIPAGRLGGSLRFDNGAWSAGGDVRRVFAQSRVSGDALDVATSAYTLVNINVTRLFSLGANSVHSVTFRADNLLDAQYRDASSRIKSFAFNPGRNLSAVYKLQF
jgi:iron complex outermembrane receptor protein